MLPPSYFHIVTVLALILTLNQSNAFTTTTYTPHQAKPTSIIATHISSNHHPSTSETSLGMTSLAAASSVSRRGFLRSAMVSCGGSLVQHRSQLPIELAADKVKDDSLDDLLEMLFGDADNRREHSSCLSEAITTTTSWDTNINKNTCADIATHLPFELVERCISRRTSERR